MIEAITEDGTASFAWGDWWREKLQAALDLNPHAAIRLTYRGSSFAGMQGPHYDGKSVEEIKV